MDEYFELGLVSYDVLPNGRVSVQFTDNIALEYVNEASLDQDCLSYDAEVIENLRKYIVCYCAHFGGDSIERPSTALRYQSQVLQCCSMGQRLSLEVHPTLQGLKT